MRGENIGALFKRKGNIMDLNQTDYTSLSRVLYGHMRETTYRAPDNEDIQRAELVISECGDDTVFHNRNNGAPLGRVGETGAIMHANAGMVRAAIERHNAYAANAA